MTTICPCCGQAIPPADDAPATEPGIIYARSDAEASAHFSRIKLEDLNGDPFHDIPLIVARFEYSLPDLVEAIREDRGRYLKGQAAAEPEQQRQQAGPSQLWQDLDTIRPHLSKIIQKNQFTYGHQSRIAEALGVPNSGSYRRRIQNVVSALQRTVVKPSSSPTPDPRPLTPNHPTDQERQAA